MLSFVNQGFLIPGPRLDQNSRQKKRSFDRLYLSRRANYHHSPSAQWQSVRSTERTRWKPLQAVVCARHRETGLDVPTILSGDIIVSLGQGAMRVRGPLNVIFNECGDGWQLALWSLVSVARPFLLQVLRPRGSHFSKLQQGMRLRGGRRVLRPPRSRFGDSNSGKHIHRRSHRINLLWMRELPLRDHLALWGKVRQVRAMVRNKRRGIRGVRGDWRHEGAMRKQIGEVLYPQLKASSTEVESRPIAALRCDIPPRGAAMAQ